MLISRLHTAAAIAAWSTAGLLFACVLDNPAYDGASGMSGTDEGETTSAGSNGGSNSGSNSGSNGGETSGGETSGGATSASTSAVTSTTTSAGDDTSTSAGPSCADLTCDPNASCVDGPDGPVCECAPGFIGDGLTCVDVDECADAGICPAGVCVNHDGGYACAFPASCAELKEAQPGAEDEPV